MHLNKTQTHTHTQVNKEHTRVNKQTNNNKNKAKKCMQQLKANTSKQLLLTNYAILTNELNPTTQFLRNQPSLGARTKQTKHEHNK